MERLRVAVLVDLPREKASGGHVKYWERVAEAAASRDVPVDLTVYFSGSGPDEILAPHVRYRFLTPVFSTERLKFLPYVPAHTDLASFHPRMAEELPNYDVIHTTDAFFAFAQTAERLARWNQIPLVTSLHTDTPAYAEIFARQTLEHIFGKWLGCVIVRVFKIPARERAKKEKRLVKHLRECSVVLAMRGEDVALVHRVAPLADVRPMRLGVDKNLFNPTRTDRSGVERDYEILAGKCVALFVGRVDAGKNMPVLMQACAQALAQGTHLHLIVAGLGPLCDEVKRLLGDNVSVAGWVEAQELARLYASVDCLVMASDVEIGGMIAVEALASGCPVLASRQNSAVQLCGRPAAMQIVESGVMAWSQALRDFAQNVNKQKTMRTSALDFRRDNLADWGNVLEQDFIPAWQAVARKKKD